MRECIATWLITAVGRAFYVVHDKTHGQCSPPRQKQSDPVSRKCPGNRSPDRSTGAVENRSLSFEQHASSLILSDGGSFAQRQPFSVCFPFPDDVLFAVTVGEDRRCALGVARECPRRAIDAQHIMPVEAMVFK